MGYQRHKSSRRGQVKPTDAQAQLQAPFGVSEIGSPNAFGMQTITLCGPSTVNEMADICADKTVFVVEGSVNVMVGTQSHLVEEGGSYDIAQGCAATYHVAGKDVTTLLLLSIPATAEGCFPA
ncbi:hypothetical protein LPB41_22135 [Thalassospira sp. MA62]|nr:hypothetical protein [Thalassospira sp. MA62]